MKRPYDTAVDAGRTARWRRFAATMCFIALGFNILFGVALSLASSQAGLNARALHRGWSIVCSSIGPIVVAADSSGIPDNPAGVPDAGAPQCLFCLPLMHGDVALAAVASVPVPVRAVRQLHLMLPTVSLATRFPSFQSWPRAPPSLPIA